MLRRFLRARDYNIGKASMMLLQYLAWKRVAKPHGSISGEEVAWRGTDTEDQAGAAMAGASARRWREDDDRRRIRRRRRGRPGPAGSGEDGVVEGEEGDRDGRRR